MKRWYMRGVLLLCGFGLGCADAVPTVVRPPPPENDGVEGFANGCYSMDATDAGSEDTRWLVRSESGDMFELSGRTAASGARFFMKASDLGTYLFYDEAIQPRDSDSTSTVSRAERARGSETTASAPRPRITPSPTRSAPTRVM